MKKIIMAVMALFALSLGGCGGGGGGSSAPETTPTVNFSAGTHGTLTGATSQTVASGAGTIAVTAVAAPGYHFVNWTDNNSNVISTANPLTMTNVTISQTITANFAINPSSAVLKLSNAGSLGAGISLSGLSVTVQLPPGVTVAADAGHVVNAGVVTASGIASGSSVSAPVYTPATATTPATLEFLVVSGVAGGFGVGEFATVNCVIASGSFPTASDFILPAAGFLPANLQLQPVTGLTAALTATIN